ncbi:MAG: dihydrolipoamide acetyltransferase family protein [Planctomycetota bacterium]
MPLADMIMPQLGESVAEGTILKWLKKPGDTVQADEMILEISTDKVDSEIPAPCPGVIKELLFKEGDTVPVRTVIARIEATSLGSATASKPQVAPAAPAPAAAKPAAAPAPAPAPVATAPAPSAPSRATGGRFYSPVVMKMSQEHGIGIQELETIPGTGEGGRVSRKDLEAYMASRGQGGAQAKTASAPMFDEAPRLNIQAGPDVNIVSMDSMRKNIAEHMIRSKRTSAHVLSVHECDVTHLVKYRDRTQEGFQQKYGFKLTYTPMIFMAVVQALKEFPWVNASVDGTNVVEHRRVNLGMAVALPTGGLIVPVIKGADEKNFLGMCRAVNDLAQRARSKKLTPDDVQGGTFTVTNPGVFGTVVGFPIINQPQVAILGMGAIAKRPVVVEGDAIAVRSMMYISLSYDHRIVDGMLAGQYLHRVCELIAQFDTTQTP